MHQRHRLPCARCQHSAPCGVGQQPVHERLCDASANDHPYTTWCRPLSAEDGPPRLAQWCANARRRRCGNKAVTNNLRSRLATRGWPSGGHQTAITTYTCMDSGYVRFHADEGEMGHRPRPGVRTRIVITRNNPPHHNPPQQAFTGMYSNLFRSLSSCLHAPFPSSCCSFLSTA